MSNFTQAEIQLNKESWAQQYKLWVWLPQLQELFHIPSSAESKCCCSAKQNASCNHSFSSVLRLSQLSLPAGPGLWTAQLSHCSDAARRVISMAGPSPSTTHPNRSLSSSSLAVNSSPHPRQKASKQWLVQIRAGLCWCSLVGTVLSTQ